MYTTTHAEPAPTEIEAWMFGGAREGRLRVLLCTDGRHRIELMVYDRTVLDALQAALDAIRADMGAETVEMAS